MAEIEILSSNKHYYNAYDDLSRFISYYYQIDLITKQAPKRILEIGIGNKTLTDYLRRNGLQVTTCDYNRDLEPDFVADIRDLPFEDNSYDLVAAFEILEHLPWSDVPVALKELQRVTSKNIIISLPHITFYFEMVLKFPLIKKIFNRLFLDFFIRLPFSFFRKCSKYHDWEIGMRDYPIRKIRNMLSHHYIITREVRPVLNPLHHFFVLVKKT